MRTYIESLSSVTNPCRGLPLHHALSGWPRSTPRTPGPRRPQPASHPSEALLPKRLSKSELRRHSSSRQSCGSGSPRRYHAQEITADNMAGSGWTRAAGLCETVQRIDASIPILHYHSAEAVVRLRCEQRLPHRRRDRGRTPPQRLRQYVVVVRAPRPLRRHVLRASTSGAPAGKRTMEEGAH